MKQVFDLDVVQDFSFVSGQYFDEQEEWIVFVIKNLENHFVFEDDKFYEVGHNVRSSASDQLENGELILFQL